MTELPTGLRMPAEWEPHAGTWFTWPHSEDTWPGCLAATQKVLAGAVRALARHETVYINALDAVHAQQARELIDIGDGSVVVLEIPSNDAWCRDHGAIFVRAPDGARHALDFGFNAWGGKYPPWDLDERIAARMADAAGLPCWRIAQVLEGGALETNGQGMLMTTASCVLNDNRNRAFGQADAEALFARVFGTRETVWLAGDLPGDDTDGHIDNLARFVSPAVALVVSDDSSAWRSLRDNVGILTAAARDRDLDIDVQTLPVPVEFVERTGLPASYANFYIANGSVLLPVYGDSADEAACRIVADALPERALVPIDCRDVIRGFGALHCLTQQLPA